MKYYVLNKNSNHTITIIITLTCSTRSLVLLLPSVAITMVVESGRPRVLRVSSKSLVRANKDSLTRWAWVRQEGKEEKEGERGEGRERGEGGEVGAE